MIVVLLDAWVVSVWHGELVVKREGLLCYLPYEPLIKRNLAASSLPLWIGGHLLCLQSGEHRRIRYQECEECIAQQKMVTVGRDGKVEKDGTVST